MTATTRTDPQRARDECCNIRQDGTCLLIQPSSWHDYSMGLPAWITPGQWELLVAGAIIRGETTIRADKRTGGSLDETATHANRHRLDMYYCPDCGRRMGHPGDVCLSCREIKLRPDDVDSRCLVTRGRRCGQFDRAILAGRAKDRLRTCPECGGDLPPRKRFCAACAKANRRKAKRQSYHSRVTRHLSENHAHKSLLAKAPKSAKTENGVYPPPRTLTVPKVP